MELLITLVLSPEPPHKPIDVVYASKDQKYIIRDLLSTQGYWEVYSPEGYIQRRSQDECRRFLDYLIDFQSVIRFQREEEADALVDKAGLVSLPFLEALPDRLPKSKKAVEASFYSKNKVEPKKASRAKYYRKRAYEAPFRSYMQSGSSKTFTEWFRETYEEEQVSIDKLEVEG